MPNSLILGEVLYNLDVTFVIIRALHVAAAAAAIGAAAFQLFALLPALKTLEPAQRLALREQIVDRWRPLVFSVIGVLLLTGLLTYVLYRIPEWHGKPGAGLYHGLLGAKILLALAVFHFATVLALPGERGAKWRANAGRWLRVMLVLMGLIVVIGAVLRNMRGV